MHPVLAAALLVAALAQGACANITTPGFGVALEGNPITRDQIAAAAKETGTSFDIGLVVSFLQWPEDPANRDDLPKIAATLDACRAAGAIPVITWEPMYYTAQGVEVIIPAARILGGDYDAYLDAFAATLAAHDGPVIVRLMHEMNLGRYHWGVSKENYNADAPAVYRDLWRHVVGRVRAALPVGCDDIGFAFCPNVESVPGPFTTHSHPWNTIAAYWPSDAWVDVLGVDGYNWGDTQTPAKNGWQSQWRTFANIFGPVVRELRALSADKPLIVFETASAATGGDKRAWIDAAFATAREWNIGAIVWFEADKEIDWRMRTGLDRP